MTNIKYYLVTSDRLDYRVISKLSEHERKSIICYAVNPAIPKLIFSKINKIEEWKLKWYTPRYQTLQYYEYGAIVHCVKNPELLEGLSHVGLLHYDVFFPENSINEIYENLDKNPHKILYNTIRKKNQLFFSYDQFKHITEFMSERLDMKINTDQIWNNVWISEALSITPIDVYRKFGEFLFKYQFEIENILNSNKWGIMNQVKHRLCGFVERMWGIYLVSTDLELEQMPIIHEWDKYQHKHLKDKQNFLKQF